MARKINRWDLLPAANKLSKGISATNVSSNRRASDRYHGTGLKDINPFSSGRGRGGAGRRLMRLARRSNNGNIPGHGLGGVPGNGLGGGLPSVHGLLHGLRKNHHAMTSGGGGAFNIPGGGSSGVPTPKIKSSPLFKPVKPLPVRKIPKPMNVKQPKPMTSTKLPPLGSAQTTRPRFARNNP